ncbi:hypothetical protein BOX37_15645 [Nocardia mangyaensis]|uniref:Histidine kinase/HSP90-like ATPase domain-containing protein n=1 Tax=Nocardia mangyaensis TaxID=2213200 RepID=A0A1J0VSW9_9NOCA|nr:ATP-binding protein [Nocardia mangyaensis]APE35144.1 hypothetical protein BOX37_15645 [Nocardia mangyaensis]
MRHAHATTVSVELVIRDEVTIEVGDDGIGLAADPTHHSGLANLAARAEQAGGTFTIEKRPDGGTLLRWSAPLP